MGGFAHCEIVNRRNQNHFKTTDEHQWRHLDRRYESQPQASVLVGQRHIAVMGVPARRTPTVGGGGVGGEGVNVKEYWYFKLFKML